MSELNGKDPPLDRLAKVEAEQTWLREHYATIEEHLNQSDARADRRHEEMQTFVRTQIDRVLRVSSAGLESHAATDQEQNARIERLEAAASKAEKAAAAAEAAKEEAVSSAATLSIHAPAMEEATKAQKEATTAQQAATETLQKILPSRWKPYAPVLVVVILWLLERYIGK